jgi:hypothetical protein
MQRWELNTPPSQGWLSKFDNGCTVLDVAAQPAEAIRLWPLPLGGSRGPKKVLAKDGVKRVLVMMSDTGGGHRASAEALRDQFEELYGGKFQVRIP